MSTLENLAGPRRSTGSKVFTRRMAGSRSSMGHPFTLIRPRPRLQYATAVAVFCSTGWMHELGHVRGSDDGP